MLKTPDPDKIPCLFCGRRMSSRCADERTAQEVCGVRPQPKTKDDFVTRFVKRMVERGGKQFDDGSSIEEYAQETAPLYWAEPDQREEGPEACADEAPMLCREQCKTCCGNGEVVVDWERYLHAFPGDVGDEAVAECPDCGGLGYVEIEST